MNNTIFVWKRPDVSEVHIASIFRIENPFRFGLAYVKLGLILCSLNLQPAFAGLLLDSACGGDMFLLNVEFF
jgi:hypothetical protein